MAIALTKAAARTLDAERFIVDTVSNLRELERLGYSRSQCRARVAARRWQQFGRAIVLHRGELSRSERWAGTLENCPAGSVLASFTAIEQAGIKGWDREEVHVLIPDRGRAPRPLPFPVVVHHTRHLKDEDIWVAQRCQRAAPAIALAAARLTPLRSACGLLAAGVQQRRTNAAELQIAITARPRMRNRHALLLAAKDIAMGAEALSEIDFVRLCRRYGLPEPTHQAVRIEPNGRRRYLDVEFRRRDGTRVAVEIDGAIHLIPAVWFADQFRQNEIVIGGTPMLRFPSFAVRDADPLVVDQLRRFLA
jgi:hypothetical protein